MEKITIYDKDNYPLDPSEITLGQIFEYKIVIINGSIFRHTDTLNTLRNGKAMTLLGVSSIDQYNEKTIFELQNDFSESIDYAKENGDIVILLKEGIDTKFPFIYANGLLDKKSFWNTVKVLNELRVLFENDLLRKKNEG